MAASELAAFQNPTDVFRRYILANLHYWRDYVAARLADTAALDRGRDRILKALSFAFELEEAWPAIPGLIEACSPYMERRGYWEAWRWVLTEAITVAHRSQDMAGVVRFSALLARLCQRQSDFKRAIAYHRQTIRMARRIGDRYNEARACSNLGYLYVEKGHWQRAETLCCHALAIFEQLGSQHGQAHTANHLGFLYTLQHRWKEARRYLKRACAIWQTMADEHGLMRGFINLGGLCIKMEQPAEALAYLEKALHLAQLSGDETAIGLIYQNMGLAQTIGGDLTQAEAYVRRADAIFRQYSNSEGLARGWHFLGAIYFQQDRRPEAILCLENALAGWRNLKNKIDEINTLLDLIEYDERAGGDQQRALARLQEAERLLGSEQANPYHRHLQLRLAEIRRSLTEPILQQAATD